MIARLRNRLQLEPWQRTLFIMFFSQMVAAMGFSIIFPFLPLYVDSLGTHTGLSLEFWAGMVFSAQAVTMALASPIWGGLADRYGRKVMVERAMFGGAVIILLMAFVRSAEELVFLRALQGLMTGTISASNALVAAEAPRKQVGYAMGLLQVGAWSGVAVGPLVGGFISDSWGYRVPFWVTSVMLLIAGLLVWRGVHESFVRPDKDAPQRPGFLQTWRHVLASKGVRLTYVVRFLSATGQNMIYPIAPLFVQALLPAGSAVGSTTGLVIGLASAASTGAAIYLGRLGDRIGHRKVLRASLLMAALLYFPQTFVSAAWQLLVLQALTGAAIGGIIPMISALLARYTSQDEAGAVYGLDNSVNSGARALAPMLSTSVAVWFGLRGSFVAMSLVFAITFVLAVWGLPARRRRRQVTPG